MAKVHARNAPSLETLPSLVVNTITIFCTRESLRNLRLTCRALYYEATRTLFAICHLGPSKESAKRFDSIRATPQLAKWVKALTLKTCGKDFMSSIYLEDMERFSREIDQLSEDTMHSFLSGVDCQNINGIALVFSYICALERDDDYLGDPPSSIEYRRSVMKLLLDFYKSLKHPSQIKSLSIEGLQDLNVSSIVDSTTFKSLISSLTSLSLSIVSDQDDKGDCYSLFFQEFHKFAGELPKIWLMPSAGSLTKLVLYFDQHVGYFPRIDLRGVHFPRLRVLALSRYVFSHDWQFDWIFGHRESLEEISLDGCPIIYARQTTQNLDAEEYLIWDGRSRNTMTDGTPRKIFTFERRWCEIFDRLRKEMPRLRDFRFDALAFWFNTGILLTRYDVLGRWMHDEMYAVFHSSHSDAGYSKTMKGWRGGKYKIYEWDKFNFPEVVEKDSKAFDTLLSHLGVDLFIRNSKQLDLEENALHIE